MQRSLLELPSPTMGGELERVLRWEGSFEAVHKAGASPGMQDVAEKAVSKAVRAAMMAWMMA